jgi:long-subunit acyl-CoA synthetase (AMP-forming)
LIKSDSVFSRYLNREKETEDSFTNDGYFKTGDEVIIDEFRNLKGEIIHSYKILGRLS